eukprot:SM000123S25875  [mRNA]  locus=s123:352283:353893:- [translate_table: standard]
MFVALALVSCAGAARRVMPEENVMLPKMELDVDPTSQAHRTVRTRLLAADSVTVDPSGRRKRLSHLVRSTITSYNGRCRLAGKRTRYTTKQETDVEFMAAACIADRCD